MYKRQIIIAVALATLVGYLIGYPVVRLRRDYISLVTLGFGEAIAAPVSYTHLDVYKRQPIDYVKWDMNRHISDNYSPALAEQGRFSHSYILGLYRVLQSIVEQNPDVLFEGCSSGGNRFDLGILCYMPVSYTHLGFPVYLR